MRDLKDAKTAVGGTSSELGRLRGLADFVAKPVGVPAEG